MAVTRKDVEAIAKGMADPIRDLVARTMQPLADIIVEQRRDIGRLEQRIADLEAGKVKPRVMVLPSDGGKPRVRILPSRAA